MNWIPYWQSLPELSTLRVTPTSSIHCRHGGVDIWLRNDDIESHWHTLVVYLVTALWWLSRSCTHSSAWLRRLDWCCWLISAAGGKILAWPSREWLVVSKVWTGPEPSPANWCLPAHTWLADGWFKLQLINRWEVREISGIPCPHNTRTVCTKWRTRIQPIPSPNTQRRMAPMGAI